MSPLATPPTHLTQPPTHPSHAADEENACALDGIASPDNVHYIPELDTLMIAEVGIHDSSARGGVRGCLQMSFKFMGALGHACVSGSATLPWRQHLPCPTALDSRLLLLFPLFAFSDWGLQDTSYHLNNVLWAMDLKSRECSTVVQYCPVCVGLWAWQAPQATRMQAHSLAQLRRSMHNTAGVDNMPILGAAPQWRACRLPQAHSVCSHGR